jgi:hypothetical protein
MANAVSLANQRRESRYGIRSGKVLPVVVVTSDDNGDNITVHGSIVDLSRNGSKVELDGPISNQTRLCLQLSADALAGVVEIAANVCWCRPTDNDRWWIGCSFDEPLSFQVLSQLALTGLIDRRNDPRRSYAITVSCRRQLNNQEISGKLVNVSVGGFGLELNSPVEFTPDERLLITVIDDEPSHVPIVGRVCWSSNETTHTMVGCSFISKDCFPELRQQLATVDQSGGKRRRRLSVRTMLGLLAGVATVAAGAALLVYR